MFHLIKQSKLPFKYGFTINLIDTNPNRINVSYREYLLSIFGLGLKSVECIRLLTLGQKAFPVRFDFICSIGACHTSRTKKN